MTGVRGTAKALVSGHPLAAAAGAAIAGAVVVTGVVMATSGRPNPGTPAVGQVTSVSGSMNLSVQAADGKTFTLHAHDALYLGDVVLPGAGVRATLELSRPSGVSADAELVFVKPLNKTTHTVKVQNPGNVTDISIGD